MPELPEVETIRRGLQEVLPGQRISSFEVRLPKVFQYEGADGMASIVGASVTGVGRRGKTLLFGLSTEMTLIIHLKMTGQLIYRGADRGKGTVVLAGGHPSADMVAAMPVKHTHATFTFQSGDNLFFNDMRQFGYIRLVPSEELDELPFMKSYGPEPLDKAFTFEEFNTRLRRRPRAKLKPLLLDQTFLAGLGNIYVDESLNLARLHPLKTTGSLNAVQRKTLYEAIINVLEAALKYGGTSDNTYVTIQGGKGDYLQHARVYHRTGLSCRECGTLIQRMVVAGRGTHYCPHCQRTPRPSKPLASVS